MKLIHSIDYAPIELFSANSDYMYVPELSQPIWKAKARMMEEINTIDESLAAQLKSKLIRSKTF
jgi:hypothetical protein